MKKVLSAVLTAALLVSTVPAAFAASDIDGHWAKSYITELHENGIINPSASTGNYGPDDKVTRWEFMRYINRAFGFTEKADISFSDVNSSDVFYETVQIAVKQGYINGYTNGTFKPQGTLSRGEIAKMLYGYMGTSLNKNGNVYSQATLKSDTKNVTISVPCTLADADIKGNLYITEGVLAGNVTLEDVTVAGDIIVSGGNVTLDGVSALEMVVSNPTGLTPQVIATGNTNIGTTEVKTSATLTESNLAATAGGFSDLKMNGSSVSLTLDAAVWDVANEQTGTILTTGSTSISTLTANGRTTVTGGGSVQKAVLNSNGCELTMQPTSVELASGVTAKIAGKDIAASTSVSVSPSTLSIDVNNKDAIAFSYEFTFNADKNDLTRVSVNGTNLKQGTDYNLLSDKNGNAYIIMYSSFHLFLPCACIQEKYVLQHNCQSAFYKNV